MSASLVIMAAGLGSRYGGSKQVDGIGPHGEILMEYAVYDALQAGFNKVVFIIKPEMEAMMEQLCVAKLRRQTAGNGRAVQVAYAFQDFSSLPQFYTLPPERVKPFGTVHALLCAEDVVQEPFCVINADDYYGGGAYRTMYKALDRLPATGKAVMVGKIPLAFMERSPAVYVRQRREPFAPSGRRSKYSCMQTEACGTWPQARRWRRTRWYP